MKTLALAALATCAAPFALTSAGGPPSSGQDPVLRFPQPSGPLVIPMTRDDAPGYSILRLLEDFGTLTGQTFLYSQETANYLEADHVRLTHEVSASPERAQEIFEGILASSDFVLTVLSGEDPRILEVTSLQTGQRNTIRVGAIFVPVEELEEMAKHPALLLTTVIHLPNTDVRQLSNSMRTMITDANTQQMLPAGNTNSLVLTGFGTNVAQLVNLLRRVDEYATPPKPPPVEADAEGENGG